MADYGHLQTEKELAALEKRIAEIYSEASKDLQKKIEEYFARFEKRDKQQRELVDAGKITEDQYKQWRLAQIGRGKRFEALRDQVAERYTKANETAVAYVNDATPGIYSLNRNYAAYTIEEVTGDVGFTLWDEQTVKRLIVEEPDLMPYYPAKKALKRGIDLAWGKQQITRQVTSGILQGEGIGKLADRLQKNIPSMNRTSAIRTARTAVTGAQNAGRMDSYAAAQKMGIELEREWLATLDNRTRHAHALLDGRTAPMDKPFEIDGHKIRFPGDSTAKPYLVYNCRCTLVARVKGVDMSDAKRRARDPETGQNEVVPKMTYRAWESQKKAQAVLRNAYEKHGSGLTMSGNDGILKEKDLRALDKYKESKIAFPLNAMLRGEAPMTEEYRSVMREIDQALLKLPKYAGTVYRSIRSAEMDNPQGFLEQHQTGAVVIYPAYSSSSTEVYDEEFDIQLVIQSKNGRDMRKYNPLENEVLFKRGSMFLVEKREGNKIWLTEL